MKIISGGQTGVDTAALVVAVEFEYPYGGWVPKGRLNENGRISDEFQGLRETDTEETSKRTVLNVRDADALLVLTDGSRSDGTNLAVEEAKRLRIPHLTIALQDGTEESVSAQIVDFLATHRPGSVNVAGPRESEAPGICAMATNVLGQSLRALGAQ